MIGALLNERYRLEALLGQGGMGEVYRAHDTLLQRDVAVKVMSAGVLGTKGRARLLQEARAVACLNHPNIVSVHDAGESETVPFIVMELVDGRSLHDRPPRDMEETITIARQVCKALDHAHSQGVIHRDLKPENVLLSPDGTAKLVDFGMARSVSSRLTGEGTVAGTVFYLAPEQAVGKEIDARTDLYALGVMLYELATGRLPFLADDPIAVISQHLHTTVVPPRARNPEIPAALDALIVRLLSKAPEDRPSSAVEVLADLERMEAASPDAIRLAEGPLPTATQLPPTGGPVTGLVALDRIVRGRMVAREREMAQARVAWQQARAGEGQVLLISGEPGIGKTRLVRELLTQIQVSGATALVGECYAEGGSPYSPFAQMVHLAFRNGASERLAAALPDFVLADLLALAPMLRMSFPDARPNPALDPQSEQQRMFESVVTFCTALNERSPAAALLLVLEDAHWADSGSLSLLRHLARRTRRHRLLIVVTYREVELDEMRPLQDVLLDLNRERLATRLRLGRLSREDTRQMLAALFEEEITDEFLDAIYRETEGNPFFIEEVCKALVESEQVYFANGRWDRQNMEEMEIPQSVRVAIQSRVRKLPDECQEVLCLAAVVGREFEFDILSEASELSEDALIDVLECAERAQLIEEVKGHRDITFSFTHALIPATLAEGVRTLRRRRLHRRAAAAIENLHPDRFESLAHHYAEAGDEEQALTYYTRAGERAAASYANQEAELHFLAALDLVEGETERADLLSELGRVVARQGNYAQAIDVWLTGIGIYQSLGDKDGVARLYAWASRAAWSGGDPPRGLALCRQGMAAVAGAAESPDTANLLHETARACLFNALPDEAEHLCRQALEAASRLGVVSVEAEALTTLGTIPGQPAEKAIPALTRAVDLAEAAGLITQAARAHNNLSRRLFEFSGDLEAARSHLSRAAELSRKRGAIAEEIFHRVNVSIMDFYRGAFAEMERALPALRELLTAIHDPGPAAYLVSIAEALILRGRGELEAAIKRMQEVRNEAREAGDLQILIGLGSYTAEALIEAAREEEAEAALQETIMLSERMAPSEAAFPRILLAMMRVRQGALADAHRLLASAGQDIESVQVQGFLLWSKALLAAAEGHWPEALAACQAAADTLARTQARWFRGRLLCEWAEIYLSPKREPEPGDLERAHELLEEARQEFEDMGVPFYVEQVAALSTPDGPVGRS